jgi:hypothetical protein
MHDFSICEFPLPIPKETYLSTLLFLLLLFGFCGSYWERGSLGSDGLIPVPQRGHSLAEGLSLTETEYLNVVGSAASRRSDAVT